MKQHIKRLGKDSVIYGLGDALKRLVTFLLLPVYTRYLTPTDYGRLEILMITSSILFTIGSQGMNSAFARSYAFSKSESQRSLLIRTSHYYLIFSACIIFGLLHLFSKPLSTVLFNQDNSSLSTLVRILAFTSLFQIVSIIPFSLYRVKSQPLKYIRVSLIGFFLQAILNVIFVAVLKIGVKGVLLGNAASAFVVVILNIFSIRNITFFTFSFPKLKDLLMFGLPLIPAGIFSWLMHFSDKYLLQRFTSAHEVGLYSVGSRFSNILSLLIIVPFMMSWSAYAFQIAASDHAKQTFKTVATYLLFILCSLGLCLIVFTPVVIKLMANDQFWDAHKVVLPLVYAGIVYGMLCIFNLGIHIAKKTHYFLYVMCFGAFFNIMFNILFIPKYGMIGAGFISFATNLVITFITYQISQKLYYVPYEKGRFLKIALVFIIASGSSRVFEMPNMYLDILFRTVLMISFFLSLYLAKFFDKREIDLIKRTCYGLIQQKGIYNKIKFGYERIRIRS
ncbi:MAG: hypothetical protein E3K32_01930 [wastewater metagenome]|nr:hypothetical protein [Candidatus Loosdrechtia aerotolerans]